MKLPSLQTLFDKSFATLIRFPFVLLAAIAGTYFAICLENLPYDSYDATQLYIRGILTASLALTLFLSVKVFVERKNLTGKVESILHLLAGGLIITYYIFLPPVINTHAIIQYVLFTIGLHLLVSFAPFLTVNEPNGFWQYNKILFLRFLTAALYSAVLYIGLSVALLAIDKLFNVNIDGKWYFRLWIIIAGIINTWLFLAGVPHNFNELETDTDYPKGLKIFTQYILLPIITVYMLILYGYEIKVLVTSHWPVGWVSYLVLAFSIAGIFSLLLIWPIRESAHNAWIKSYSRFYYLALFPLIVMLFIAIFKRELEYGITENRYFIIVLAFWLTCISLYFVFSNRKNIKLIPLSLCLIAFLTSFGPWGAFSISKNSQYKRLYSLLDKNKILKEGKVQKADKEISFQDRKAISSIVEYMVDVHGGKSLQPLFAEPLKDEQDSASKRSHRFNENEAKNNLLDKMGIKYVSRYDMDTDVPNHYYNIPSTDYTDVKGYDVLFNYEVNNWDSRNSDSLLKVYNLKNDKVKASFNFKNQTFKVFAADGEIFSLNIKDAADKIKKTNGVNINEEVNPALMTFENSFGPYKTRVVIASINFSEPDNKFEVHNFNVRVLLKKGS